MLIPLISLSPLIVADVSTVKMPPAQEANALNVNVLPLTVPLVKGTVPIGTLTVPETFDPICTKSILSEWESDGLAEFTQVPRY